MSKRNINGTTRSAPAARKQLRLPMEYTCVPTAIEEFRNLKKSKVPP